MSIGHCCRSFYKFAETVCRYATKRRFIEATAIRCYVVQRRTFSGTANLHSPHSAFFISDKQWTYDVIESCGLSESSDQRDVVILHLNPGNSVLIESLFETCSHKQFAWEPCKLYADYLISLTEIYKTQFSYCSCSFVRDSHFKVLDEAFSDDGSTNAAMFHAKIVGNVPDMYMLIPKLVLLLSGSSKFHISKFGIIEPILIVTGSEYRLMMEAAHFWPSCNYVRTALYELLFKTELLKTVPLTASNYAKQFLLKSTRFDYDRENLYIVRLSLQRNFNSIDSHDDLVGIMLFLRMISKIKKRRVIPAMEQLCPDSGIMLLRLGVSMMDRFRDIPLKMWPEIYHAITTSSQFSNSALKQIFQQM